MQILQEKGLQILESIYINFGLHDKITDLIDWFDNLETYKTTFASFVSGVYFIFGKPLVTSFIVVVGIILTIRIAMSIINLVWP